MNFFKIAGIIVGIVSFFFVREFFALSLESLGISTYIDYGEEVCIIGVGGYEDCDTGTGTDIALFFGILSAVIAIGIGNIIYSKNFPPFSSSNKEKITYLTWLICSLIVSMTGVFIILIFGAESGSWINLVIAAIIAYYGYQHVSNLPND